MITIAIILLAILSAYREVQILIDRGSWRKEDYRNVFWKTNWQSWLKNFDSFHVSNGLFVLIMITIFVGGLTACPISTTLFQLIGISLTRMITLPIDIIIYWFLFMQVRNICLHIIFKKHPDWDKIYKFWR